MNESVLTQEQTLLYLKYRLKCESLIFFKPKDYIRPEFLTSDLENKELLLFKYLTFREFNSIDSVRKNPKIFDTSVIDQFILETTMIYPEDKSIIEYVIPDRGDDMVSLILQTSGWGSGEEVTKHLDLYREENNGYDQWFAIISKIFPGYTQAFLETNLSLKEIIKLLVVCEFLIGKRLVNMGSGGKSRSELEKKILLEQELKIVPKTEGGTSLSDIAKMPLVAEEKDAIRKKFIAWDKDREQLDNVLHSDQNVVYDHGVETTNESFRNMKEITKERREEAIAETEGRLNPNKVFNKDKK